MKTDLLRRGLLVCSTSACLALATLSSAVYAQQTPQAGGTPVHMVVTIEPRHGTEVSVVNREDILVYEGKTRDQVTDWVPAQIDRVGLEIFILIDDSANTELGTQLGDVKKFIAAQPAGAKIGVVYMQNGIARVEQNLTSDHDLAAKAVRLPMGVAGAEASPYFSLSDLAKKWQPDGTRHEALVVSNGIDLYYGSFDMLDPYLAAAIEDAQRAGIIVSAIYTPGVGHYGHSHFLNYWGQMYLAKLAEETGGEAYYIGFNGPAVDFGPYLKDFTERLSRQYVLTFLAKPQKKSGMQPVRLRTELHNVDLVSANKVYVPASE